MPSDRVGEGAMTMTAREAGVRADLARLRGMCQRIRAGWLPHRLSSGSWWWGRPYAPEGFGLWSDGLVPSMSVVEAMTPEEIVAWESTLHPMAPEIAK